MQFINSKKLITNLNTYISLMFMHKTFFLPRSVILYSRKNQYLERRICL